MRVAVAAESSRRAARYPHCHPGANVADSLSTLAVDAVSCNRGTEPAAITRIDLIAADITELMTAVSRMRLTIRGHNPKA